MGTWGHHAFQNDEAGDFESALEEDGFSKIESAFDAVIENDGYLEAPDSQCAVAAAEALCIVLRRPGPSIPEEVTQWAERQDAPSPELIAKAKKSLARILRDSELKELWSESPEYDIWEASISDMINRLG
jgi:hypothetical protein